MNSKNTLKPLQDLIWLTAILMVTVVWYSGLNLFFLSPVEYKQLSVQDISVNVTYPRAAFYKEDWGLDVTVSNQGKQKSEPVNVVLNYAGQVPLLVEPEKTTLLEFGALEAGERKTQRISLAFISTGSGIIKKYLTILVNVDVHIGTKITVSNDPINLILFPLEGVRNLSKFIASLLGIWVTWLGKQWWDLRHDKFGDGK
jgi:hypothetical protein